MILIWRRGEGHRGFLLLIRLAFSGREIHPARKGEIMEMQRRHRGKWGQSPFFSSGGEARVIAGFCF
jgi:hypothetical protein